MHPLIISTLRLGIHFTEAVPKTRLRFFVLLRLGNHTGRDLWSPRTRHDDCHDSSTGHVSAQASSRGSSLRIIHTMPYYLKGSKGSTSRTITLANLFNSYPSTAGRSISVSRATRFLDADRLASPIALLGLARLSRSTAGIAWAKAQTAPTQTNLNTCAIA